MIWVCWTEVDEPRACCLTKWSKSERDKIYMYQFSSVAQSCLPFCDPMACSMPGFPVHYQLPELAQTHVYRVGDAIQPSHPLSSPSPPAFNLSQHQRLFRWISSSHQVARVLEVQLQHQSFQWRTLKGHYHTCCFSSIFGCFFTEYLLDLCFTEHIWVRCSH